MNVLVTGGTGVLGTAAIPPLMRDGHKIRLLSRHAERDVGHFPEGIEPMEADIGQPEEVERAMDGCGAVLHLAGIVEEDPPDATFERVNVEGTRSVVRAAENVGRPLVVFVSSLGAESGRSEYHHSKRRAEDIVRGYSGPWLILRPGNVYGPGDDTVSMLVKMIRSLPAVPMVSLGDQPFQPLWYADFGEIVAQAMSRPALARRMLDIAGPDVTTTDDLLQRLARITGRNVPRLSIPVWVTEVGVRALDAFGAMGRRWLETLRLGAPLNPAKLDMLLEGNVIGPGATNAIHEFLPEPTSLDDGLRMLVDLLPEQLPGDGVGALQSTTYWADIQGSPHDPRSLLDLVCARIHEIMPIEFAAEPASPRSAVPGGSLTGNVGARGNIQVRLEQRTEFRATFVTLEGHPLAGVMQLHTEAVPNGVRFQVHVAAQPANIVDWLAMRTIGGPLQRANWRNVVRRVVWLSGGVAPADVHYEVHTATEREARDLRTFAEAIVQQTRKTETLTR